MNNEDEEWIRREWIRHEGSKPLTLEKTITINLDDKENPKEVKIGKIFPSTEAEKITDLLKEYQDIFAWSYADMPGLDPDIVEHALPTYPSILPKKQKLR